MRSSFILSHAVLVAQLLYASPAWSGFLKADEMSKLQMVLNKSILSAVEQLMNCLVVARWLSGRVSDLRSSIVAGSRPGRDAAA